MAAGGEVVLASAPQKKQVMIDIKCAKCCKIVRNGFFM